ncbi:MAG TPA: hypothetical protein DEB46_13375 [Myxococcales bacterium]|nr:hypothetical protein [Myxococcales bacterium]
MRFIPISGLLGMAVLVVSTTAWFVWGYPLQSSTAYASGGRTALGLYLDGPWTLMSAGLLHRDLHHLLWNLIPGIPLLFLLERRYGRTFLTSASLAALVLGLLGGHLADGKTAVGFSPVLFAALGGLLSLPPRQLPKGFAWLIRVYACFALIASFRMPEVDETSHIVGLLIGLLLGSIARVSPRWVAPTVAVHLAVVGLCIPMIQGVERVSWTPPLQGLSLAPPANWRPSSSMTPATRCAPALDLCVEVDTKTTARINPLGRGLDGSAPSVDLVGADEAILENDEAGHPCLQIRRGLYQHRICVRGPPVLRALAAKVLERWFLAPSFSRPGEIGDHSDPLVAALEEHRLGRIVEARKLYRKAVIERPQDAKVHFLFALLEADFGERTHARSLARQAVHLDPLHPAGHALLEELVRP